MSVNIAMVGAGIAYSTKALSLARIYQIGWLITGTGVFFPVNESLNQARLKICRIISSPREPFSDSKTV
jgi:hypothetical protein